MKKVEFRLILIVVCLVLFPVFFGVLNVTAEDGGSSSMVVSPMSQKMILTPGEVATGSIKVSNPNTSKRDLKYAVEIGSFSQKKSEDSIDDYGTVDTEIVSNYNMLMEWIVLENNSGSVAPNETDVIRFTINVPEDAPAGGQYATILVRDETEQDSGNGNVAIQNVIQIASIIYADVTGETSDEAQILGNNIPGFIFSSPLVTNSMVRNDGNVHTNANYILQVWPIFSDEEVCTNEENPSEGIVMPETDKYHIESCNLPIVGIFRAKQTVSIFGEKSIVEKVVIVCPLWLLFLVIALIVGIVIWFIIRARDRGRRIVA